MLVARPDVTSHVARVVISVNRKWKTMDISGRQPEPRSFHTATTVGKRVVVLGGRGITNQHFGDVNIFDVGECGSWLFYYTND